MWNKSVACNCFLVATCIAMLIAQQARAQGTSTPEERMQWVEVTHKLESIPLDDSVNKQGEAALKRVSNVHDFHVLLCPGDSSGPMRPLEDSVS